MGESGVTENNHLHLSVQGRECKTDPNCDLTDDSSTNLYEIMAFILMNNKKKCII